MPSSPNPAPAPAPGGERSPLLRVYGALADRMAIFLRIRPSLLPRVIFAPPEALHATAAFLHLAIEADRPDPEVAEFIEQRHPRDLLYLALPDAPAELYKAMARAGDRVRAKNFYARIGTIASESFGVAFIGSGPLDDSRLGYFEALGNMDPAVVAMHHVLPEDRGLANAIESIVVFLRAHAAVNDDDLRLPAKSGLAAVNRRLRHALDRVQAPSPGFAIPPPLRLIETIGEQRSIGRRFRNCLNERFGQRHWFALASGETVYLTADEPPLVLSLRRVAPGVYHIDEMVGLKNSYIDGAVRKSVLDSFKATGVRIIGDDPSHAISALEYRCRRPGDIGDGEQDQGEDDDIAA